MGGGWYPDTPESGWEGWDRDKAGGRRVEEGPADGEADGGATR